MQANKDQDRLNPIEWWNIYDTSTTHLHKLAVRMISQVVNTSCIERFWSTYNFIHIMNRNNLNVDTVESWVYVNYKLRLLPHYCEEMRNDKTYVTVENNSEEDNLESGAMVL